MSTPETAQRFDLDALREAIETRDAATQAAMYAEDAEMVVIDADRPPSTPQRLEGRAAIQALLEDVCARDLTHTVERALRSGDLAAVTVACRYGDGTRVQASSTLDLRDGRIVRCETVQAWDPPAES